MRHSRLTFGCSLCLLIFATAGCGRKSTSQLVGESPVAQSPAMSPAPAATQSPSAAPSNSPSPEVEAGQSSSPDLAQLETRVRPSVVWVTVFDSKGNLLRTQSGFFISADGRFVTTARAIEGGINAVAKAADGGIYNVTGILAASKESDLAILQADVKPRKLLRFLDLNKSGNLSVGAGVAVVGSTLAGSEGSARKTTIATQEADGLEIAGPTPVSSVGSPVVNENGEVIGVVMSAGEKTTARASNALASLLATIASDASPRWPEMAQATVTPTPVPRPTPKPRLVYAPAPAFPSEVRSRPGAAWSGRFRLVFNGRGNVTNIQIVQSTGNNALDQSALTTLRQWKSAPGQEWVATVPVTFQSR